MKITMTVIIERQQACFFFTQIKTNYETFYIQNPYTLQKARQFLLRFYRQKAIHITLYNLLF